MSLEMRVRYKTAVIGEVVTLRCGDAMTSNGKVDWHFQASIGEGRAHKIVFGGHVISTHFEDRLGVIGSTLVINNAKKNDSGFYICVEDASLGVEHRHSLTVSLQGNYKLRL